jgi:ketosteroid isomerase-like protein
MFRLSLGQTCIAVLILGSSYAFAQTSLTTTELQLKQPVERTIAAGEVHSYSVKLEQSQILKVVASQRGADVVVRAFAPDGTKLGEFDSPTGGEGPETVDVFADQAGKYRIEVALFATLSGKYEINVVELRAATKAEAERHRAEKELLAQEEQQWDEANRVLDVSALDHFMADDYVNYSARGQVSDKRSFLAGVAQRKAATTTTNMMFRHEMDSVALRVYGDAAMSSGRVVISSTQNGREQKFPGRFVHLWLLRGGRWQIAGDMYFQDDPLPVTRTEVKLAPGIVDSYVGTFDVAGGPQIIFIKKGADLVVDFGGFQDTLTAESDTELFSKNAGVEFTFVRNSRGDVTHMIIVDNGGRASKGIKVPDKPTM